jgi:hypothetical protein
MYLSHLENSPHPTQEIVGLSVVNLRKAELFDKLSI